MAWSVLWRFASAFSYLQPRRGRQVWWWFEAEWRSGITWTCRAGSWKGRWIDWAAGESLLSAVQDLLVFFELLLWPGLGSFGRCHCSLTQGEANMSWRGEETVLRIFLFSYSLQCKFCTCYVAFFFRSSLAAFTALDQKKKDGSNWRLTEPCWSVTGLDGLKRSEQRRKFSTRRRSGFVAFQKLAGHHHVCRNMLGFCSLGGLKSSSGL